MQIKNIKIYQNGEWQIYTLQTVDLLSDIVSNLQPRMTDAEDRLFSLEQTDKTHGSNITTNANNINTLSQDLSTLEGKVATHTTEISGMKSSVEQAAGNAMTANTRLDSLEPRMTEAEDRLSSLENSDAKMDLIEDAFSVYTEDLSASSAVNKLTLYEIGYNQSGYKTTMDARGKFLKEDLYSYTSYELQLPDKSGTLATLDDIGSSNSGANLVKNKTFTLYDKVGIYAESQLEFKLAGPTYQNKEKTAEITHDYFIPSMDDYNPGYESYSYEKVTVRNKLPQVNGELAVRPKTYITEGKPIDLSVNEWKSYQMDVTVNYSLYQTAGIDCLRFTLINNGISSASSSIDKICAIVSKEDLYTAYYKYLMSSDKNLNSSGLQSSQNFGIQLRFVYDSGYYATLVIQNIQIGENKGSQHSIYDTSDINDFGNITYTINFSLLSGGYINSVTPEFVCTGAATDVFTIDSMDTY